MCRDASGAGAIGPAASGGKRGVVSRLSVARQGALYIVGKCAKDDTLFPFVHHDG